MQRPHILYRFAWVVSVIMHVLLSLYFLRSESYTRGLIIFNFIDGYWDLLLHPRGYMAWLLFNPKSCPMLWSHGPQHARLPCPSLTPGVCSNSRLLSRWFHPTISSSVVPFSSCLQSFTASWSFPMSGLFAPGGQSIRASASATVRPMNIQSWFLLRLTGFFLLAVQGTPKSLLHNHSSKASILYGPNLTSIHDYSKTIALTLQTIVGKVMSLLFNILPSFIIVFLPRLLQNIE